MRLDLNTIIIAITVLVSLAANGNSRLFTELLFSPFVIKARSQWYRFITHAFVHAGTMHLFVNMFVLYMFGRSVLDLFDMLRPGSGTVMFALLYLGGILFSSLPAFRKHLHDPNYNAVGASGAVSAVLFAHILMLPMSKVYFLFIPIGIPAFLFGGIYLAYEYYMDKKGGDHVAHDAHFFGALFGIIFTSLMQPRLILEIGYLERALGL